MRGALPLALAVLLPGVLGLAAAGGPTLPLPGAGEVFVYVGEAGMDGDLHPTLRVVRFRGPEPVLDRFGAERSAYVAEQVFASGGARIDPRALLDDTGAPRAMAFHDLATSELLQERSRCRCAMDMALGAAGMRLWERAEETVTEFRAYAAPGFRDPYADLWGRELPAGPFEVAFVHTGFPWLRLSDGAFLLELAGASEPPAQLAPTAEAYRVPATFHPHGKEAVAGRDAWAFRAEFRYRNLWGDEAEEVHEVWLADGLALPVRQRVAWAVSGERGSMRHESDYTLADHLPATDPLPWGVAGRSAGFQPALGPWDRFGPSDGGAGLRYALDEAVERVRADPTLAGFQRLEAEGDPVLVGALHMLREARAPERAAPEARWQLLFRDAQGREALVESKRLPAAPLALTVNREQGGAEERRPDLGPVGAGDPGPLAPTLAGALAAWTSFRAGGAGEPDTLYYGAQRDLRGALRPWLWVGAANVERSGVPAVAGREARQASLLAVGPDGYPRVGLETWSSARAEVPLAAAAAGPALPAPPAAPSLPPAVVAGGLGAAALAGLALKVLAPLYSRLSRDAVLQHPLRRRLLALVEAQPGLHLEAVRAHLGVSGATVAHHARVLARTGLLQVHRAGRFRRLYPLDATPAAVARDAALHRARSAALHALVRAEPGIGLREAARRLGAPPSSLHWHLRQLEAAGLVERRRDGLHPAQPSAGAAVFDVAEPVRQGP